MGLAEIRDFVGELVVDHWMKVLGGVAMLLIGRFWGRRRALREWSRKRFLHRLMVSLNSVSDDERGRPTLRIRTILEKDIQDVFLNPVAVERVLAAARETSDQDPILPLATEDRWILQNAVLNEIAEHFAAGALAADMGLDVVTARYVFCLTHETAGPVRTRKIRAMIVRKDRLLRGDFEAELMLEADSHAVRLQTLRFMREEYRRDPSRFLELDLSLPATARAPAPSRSGATGNA